MEKETSALDTLMEYLNSQFSALQEVDFFARILLACLCGACIGFERSKRLKEAGIRTHIIVCCAAALLMMTRLGRKPRVIVCEV